MSPKEMLVLADTLGGFPTDEPRRRAAAFLRQCAAQEPVATVKKHTGSLGDMAIIVWTGEQPPEGTPLFAAPAVVRPLTKPQRMEIINAEFPLSLVQPIIIQKIDTVCRAIEQAIFGSNES